MNIRYFWPASLCPALYGMIGSVVNLPVSSTFVGRGGELATLLDGQRDPLVHAVLVAGEAGIGKSRLIREFTDRLPAETPVLIGRCPEFGNEGVPFAPFIAIMRTLIRRLGAERLAALLPVRPALGRWLPELPPDWSSDPAESDRIRLFGEILTLFERLAAAEPAVVVIEDLHWADDSSRELLAFLVANLAATPVLLVGTYRPVGAPELRQMLAELARNPGVRTIAPTPFTKHEVGRQLAAIMGNEPESNLVARVFERSAGNPLFVAALSLSAEDTPAELSELLLACRSGLSDDALVVLQVSAVAGSPVGHELVEAAAELPERALNAAVRELIDHRLLVTVDTGYEFHHVLLKRAVYADLLPIERNRLHARLARLLQAYPNLVPVESRSAELAEHARAAGDLALALEASWAASGIAEHAGAQSERLRHLERVLELWDKVPASAERSVADRLDVLEQIIDACFCGATGKRGIEAADEAIEALDARLYPHRAALLRHRRAFLRTRAGQGGRDDLLRALELLPSEAPTQLRGEVQADLAGTLAFGGRSEDAARHAAAALEVGEQLAVPSLIARANAYLGLTATDTEMAMAYFADANAAADDPRTLLDVVTWESAMLVAIGDYDKAIHAIQQGLRAAHETFRFTEQGPLLTVKWVQALHALGRWDEAVNLVDESLAESVPPLSAAVLRLNRAGISLTRGHLDKAGADADTAGELLGGSPWAGQYRLELAGVRSRLALARGSDDQAAAILAEALVGDELMRHPREAWMLLVLGARIPDLPVDLTEFAAALSSPTPVGAAYRTVYTAVASGDPTIWADAVRRWRALGQREEEARSLLGAAEAALVHGNRSEAEASLRDASTIATELGAAPLLEEAQSVASRARLGLDTLPGVAASSRQVAGPFGLTPRELEVLRLVAEGLTNRRVAEELFISPNTAGVHVSRILTKLGAASRTEAAAAAHRHRLLAD
ncbi:ATP-binding protein [Rhodococcus sp. NPDC058514]